MCDDLGSNIWYSVGPIFTLNIRSTDSDYVDNLFDQVLPIIQLLFHKQ